MFHKFLILTILCLAVSSCEDEPNSKISDGTYLGGQVINPINNYVTIRKDDVVLARPQLNQNNRFLYQFKDFQPGLYEFVHKERQLVYLDDGDSVTFRVNTLEYDESLTFTGYGADKNNFLIEMFLLNEVENEYMARKAIYRKSPEAFEKYLDSLSSLRNARWSEFQHGHSSITQDYTDIAKASMNYDIYARKEVYPLTSFVRSKLQRIDNIPEEFYDYRSSISFNEERFLPLYSYQRFLYNYLNQAAFKKYAEDEAYDAQSFTHNLIELKIIDSLVQNKMIKDFLMTRTVRNFLVNNNDKEQSGELYSFWDDHSPSSSSTKTEIKQLYERNKKIETGRTIPDEMLMDRQLNEVSLLKIIKQPSVIYFWSSSNTDHMIRSHLRARKLRERYPQYEVISINIDPDTNIWLQTMEDQGFEKEYSYHFTDALEKLQDDLALGTIVRTFITDEKGTILNAHANMFGTKFESQLLGYINRTD